MTKIKEEITRITLDTMMGIRNGVGEARVKEFTAYLQNLIEAKEAGIDPTTLQWPMLMDRVKQGVEAALSSTASTGAEGGIEWTFINLSGKYGKETQQGIKLKVDMEFMSIGAPELDKVQALSVEDLKKLMEVVEK